LFVYSEHKIGVKWEMTLKRLVKLVCFSAIVLLAYIIPYTVLSGFSKLWGAYLFWVVLTFIAVVFMWFELSSWREET